MSVERAFEAMNLLRKNLAQNGSRQNSRRIDRLFLKVCKTENVTPKEVFLYAQNGSKR